MLFKLLLQLGLHVVLPLTSYDLFSQILSVYERFPLFSFFVFAFFGGEGLFCSYFRKRKSAKIYD